MIVFLYIEIEPRVEHPEYDRVGGSFVTCWIDADDVDTAAHEAHTLLREEQWEVVKLQAAHTVERSEYADDEEALAYFDEAVREGAVYVFHNYPRGQCEDEPQ